MLKEQYFYSCLAEWICEWVQHSQKIFFLGRRVYRKKIISNNHICLQNGTGCMVVVKCIRLLKMMKKLDEAIMDGNYF